MMEPILFYLVVNFYALELIKGKMVVSPKHFSRSWDKLWDDINNYSEQYNSKLANMFYDHIIKCVQCELRHCKNHSEFYIPNFYGDGWFKNYDDQMCYASFAFNPTEILRAGKWLFDDNNNYWCYEDEVCEYGGEAWQDISEAGLEHGKVSDIIFIDHLIDLEHNNEVVLFKPTGLFMHTARFGTAIYYEMLKDKRYQDDDFIRKYSGYLCQEVLQFISRYQYLSRDVLIPETDLVKYRSHLDKFCEKSVELLLNYKPIRWGNKMVSLSNLQKSPLHETDYDEEDGDWY